jgi:hypothetical protein
VVCEMIESSGGRILTATPHQADPHPQKGFAKPGRHNTEVGIVMVIARQRRSTTQTARHVIRLKNLHHFLRSLHPARLPDVPRITRRGDYRPLRTERWGDPMATHGEIQRPPVGRINGRLRGELHGRRQTRTSTVRSRPNPLPFDHQPVRIAAEVPRRSGHPLDARAAAVAARARLAHNDDDAVSRRVHRIETGKHGRCSESIGQCCIGFRGRHSLRSFGQLQRRSGFLHLS